MRRLMSAAVAFLALVSYAPLVPSAHSQQPLEAQIEAFGMRFGDSPAQAKAKGLIAAISDTQPPFTVYKATRLPAHPSNTDLVSIVFVDKVGLQKITWMSTNFADDISGRAGKEAYTSLKATLEKKYGAPSRSFESVGLKLYDEYDEFYQCLAYAGCGMWMTLWEGPFGIVGLAIESTGRRGSGWLQVTYEGPRWAETIDAKQAQANKQDADAF